MAMKKSTIDGRVESWGLGWGEGYNAGMSEGLRRANEEHDVKKHAENRERDRLEQLSRSTPDEPPEAK